MTEATEARYYGIMNHETKRWLARLLEKPDDFAFSLEDMVRDPLVISGKI